MSAFAHVPWVVAIQLIGYGLLYLFVSPDTDGLWIAGIAGFFTLFVREVTQREYQWIENFGGGKRANMPDLVGLKFWQWNRHSIEETIVSGIAAAAVWAAGVFLLG